MSKASKALSILLIIASLFGLFGGSLALKDALGSKAYWESASAGGDSIGMLEDGLNQLKENEEAYLAGREALAEGKTAYAEGVKALEDGQKQYDEGKALLEEKQAEYDAGADALVNGKYDLVQGKKKLDEGKAQYAAGEAALEEGKKQLEAAGWDTVKSIYDNVNTLIGNGMSKSDAITTVAAAAANKEIEKNNDAIVAGVTAEVDKNKDAIVSGVTAAVRQNIHDTKVVPGVEQVVKKNVSDTIENMVRLQVDSQVPADTENRVEVVNQAVAAKMASDEVQANIAAETAKQMESAEVKAQIEAQTDAAMQTEEAKAAIDQNVAATRQQYIDEGVKNYKQQLLADNLPEAKAKVTQAYEGMSAYVEGSKQLAAAKEQLDAGEKAYREGYAKYYDGKQQLADGAVQLEEGKKALEDAAKQLEEGKAQLADAEKQIADGEAQLAVFEDGRDQVIAGLNTAIATEAVPGVKSIAERLGDGFNFMKNDTDLDIDKGLEVVAAARAYAADTTGSVTKEIKGKAIGAVVALVGSAIALLGGIIGVPAKKPRLSGVIALLGGIAVVVGAVMSGSVGSTFSQIAGAAGSSLPTIAEVVTAVAALPQAIASFAAKTAAAK